MKRFFVYLGYCILTAAATFLVMVLVVQLVFAGNLAVVLSNSMAPAMPAGALAIMVPVEPAEIEVGNIISFTPPWDTSATVSHRVIGIRVEDGLHFDTKGDAVEDSDPYYIPANKVLGRVIFNVPHLGRLFNAATKYVRTWVGLVLLVALPAAIIILGTVIDIRPRRTLRQKRLQLIAKRRQRWGTSTF